MLYIRLKNNKEIEHIDSIIDKARLFFKSNIKFESNIVENISIITINKITKKSIKKLEKYLITNCVKNVVLSDNLFNEEKIVNVLNDKNIKILNGKWITKFLVKNILEYVCKKKNDNINRQEVTVLVNDLNEVVYENLKDVAKLVRMLNVISSNKFMLKKLEKDILVSTGTVINTNKNYNKTMQKTSIVINFDFNEDELNKFNFPRKLCLVNINDNIRIKDKCFSGLVLNKFDIKIPVKYFEKIMLLKDFNSLILYESFIYKNTSPMNIIKEIKKDNIVINYSEGKLGKLNKNEYMYLVKND